MTIFTMDKQILNMMIVCLYCFLGYPAANRIFFASYCIVIAGLYGSTMFLRITP